MTIANFFIPNRQIIQSITNANPGVVTTTQDHGYSTGLFVRLVLPDNFGMQQVNDQVYEITVQSPTTFAINSDTTNFDSFALLSSVQSPQVIPVGSDALSILEAVQNNGTILPTANFLNN